MKEGAQDQNLELPTYTKLFFNEGEQKGQNSFLLIKLEYQRHHKRCYEWLKERFIPFPAYFFPLSKTVACLLETGQDHDRTVVQEECQRMLEDWLNEGLGRMNIAVYPCDDATIYQMYMGTKEMMELEFYKGYQQIYFANKKIDFKDIDPFLNPEEQRTWVTMLEKRNKQGIKNWLYNSFAQFPEDYYPRPDLMRIKLTSILAQLRRFMYTYKLNGKKSLEERYHQVFQFILYEPVLFKIVQEMLLFTIQLVHEAEAKEREETYDTVERGLQYIEANFHQQDLTLETVAIALQRSPSYLSALFSKKRQETFGQIVANYRLERGKKLLRETDLTIQEIAYQVVFPTRITLPVSLKKRKGQHRDNIGGKIRINLRLKDNNDVMLKLVLFYLLKVV
ncbi:MAG: AraC family transcriptional regulator [Bacillus sp. (in: Bacteria)]|nr:AraC family transcriptional regulator [Bacillus sp. (in: firmicutes)]